MDIKYNLAAAYRIMAYLSLDYHTYTHLSARPENADFYYIYPFGLRFEEVTTENLLKVSLDGKILEGEKYQYNKTGYFIHGSIYKARSDISAIFHYHTPAAIAVSALKCGLLPISQWALHFYDRISYHDYNSLKEQKLIIPSVEICKQTEKDLLSFEKDLGKRDWEAWLRLVKM
ncbi:MULTISPECIES: class II aldolase/adducin family protein [spotted fever group]|uniref:Class II aldolase/adducin N-terminal domain-containing protein n=1 Tax=Rickettsia tamurae subsp. buchneri TaxID=1462938 RepID=A0A8E0WL61_9RICK|nr:MULTISPECIES: class II aldolase/adducin family protein [spotted fever group]EER22040.1 erythrocyte adducin alpha subunit [Rickettsia endosymbiont of Ixodes scapularis]KDO02673.1 hypothetical protein REISMN_05730 [Rickettsia tamurae subsp. buchneri]